MASLSVKDRDHERCAAIIRGARRDSLVVPMTVAVEVDHLARKRVGRHAAAAFLTDLDEGPYVMEPVDAAMLSRAREIDDQYEDADLGLVDASVVAVAEALGAGSIFTLDQHFRMVPGAWTIIP